jgi:hypothetical protein
MPAITGHLLVLTIAAGLASAGAVASSGFGPAQDADVYAKRGVYVETDRGVSEMRAYAEATSLHDSLRRRPTGT